MLLKKISSLFLIILWANVLFAAAPSVDSVKFFEQTNILTLYFNGDILTSPAYFAVGGLTLDDDDGSINPDVNLNGGAILNNTITANFIDIYLIFPGYIGSYSQETASGMVTYDTWGNDYSRLKAIESFANKDNIKLLIRENTYLSANYETNDEVALAQAPLVEYVPYAITHNFIGGSYDASINRLTLIFDSDIQWDTINEDRIDPATGQGDGVLNYGEDRNGNGVLDVEPNLIREQFSISDGEGVLTLSTDSVLTLYDSDTIEIKLLPDNAKNLESLNLNSLFASFPAYTFLDLDYNSITIPLTDSASISVIPDASPLYATSANYDMEYNKLTIYFSENIANDYKVIPKISFVVSADTIALQGSSQTPVITSNHIEIALLLMDQQSVETPIYALSLSQIDTSVQIIVDDFAFRDNVGNYNLYSVIDPLTVNYSTAVPVPQAVSYNANSDILEISFDLKIKSQPEDINIPGFSLLTGADTITFTTQDFTVSSNKQVLYLDLNSDDEYLVEGIADTANILLLMEPYTVLQKQNGSGCFPLTTADSLFVTWIPDSTPPLPKYFKYNEVSKCLEVHFNEAMDSQLDFSKILYSGKSVSGVSADFGEDHSWLILNLTSADSSFFSTITPKDSIYVDLTQGAFKNVRGAEISTCNFADKDTLIAGADSVVVLTGYGRNFYLQSQELTATLDRIIPASIRQVGLHSIIYVADDQWQPYYSVNMGLNEWKTDNNYIPIISSEVEAVYNFFEVFSAIDTTLDSTGAIVDIDTIPGAYYKLNELFADGDSTVVPVANIFLCDIRDEFQLDRTGGNSTPGYWVGDFFNSNDQFTALQAGEDFNTNQMDLIYIDSWPQLFSNTDMCYYWSYPVTNPAWTTFSATNNPVTGFNAIVNAYTKLLLYKADPWESKWLVEGLASLAEFMVNGQVSFYGAGNPTTPSNDGIKNMDKGLKVRTDYFNTYLFMLYLYEKFGGEDLTKILALRPTVDMASIDSSLVILREQKYSQGDTLDTAYDNLVLFTTQYDHKDLFTYYGMACLMDTTNMAFTDSTNPALYDSTIPPDYGMFKFDNADLYLKVTSKPSIGMKWDPEKDPPPYYFPQDPYCFKYYYTTYGVGLENPLINDSTVINILTPFDEINAFEVLLKNDGTSPNLPNYYFHYYDYDTCAGEASFPVSPYANWTPGLDSTDYKCFVILGSLEGTIKITMDSQTPDYYLSLAQSSIISNRFDVFLVVSDEVFGNGTIGQDLPQLRYYQVTTGTPVEYSVTMSENNLISPPADTLGLSFYSCFLNLTSPGTYNLYVYFTDLGGEPVVTASDTFIVETYDPASGAKLGLNGSQFELLSNSYSQPLKLSLFTINGNASADGSQSFLSDGVYYLAPPVTERTAIGPAYLLQPGVMLDEPASVILPYGDYIGGFSPGALGVYLYRDGGWVYLDDPNINPENQTISVRTKQLGLFQVQAGPHDPTPADLLIPDHYALKQNYPNPFNPQTRIDYQLPHAGETTLKIYNIRGQEIATLVDGFQNTGFYSVTWNGTANGGIPVASGIYLFRLHSGNFSRTHKMILLK